MKISNITAASSMELHTDYAGVVDNFEKHKL